jgi:ribonuclease BN (tRNA processing enzyme)
MTKNSGISLRIIGDSGPFSVVGKSICYKLIIGEDIFLVDCGAPLFELIGPDKLMQIKGIFGTHSHDDHKRTFTDLALFYLYEGKGKMKLPLITTETIHEEFHKSSKAAIERSLSIDSKRVVDVPYDMLVEKILFGPRAKYKIDFLQGPHGGGIYRVVDKEGNVVEPSKAKVFISPKSNIPRMLFRDSETGEWVEPSSYYDFSSDVFYEKDKNAFRAKDGHYSMKAINAHSWHGIPCFGVEFKTEHEKLIITSDTVYDPVLWEQLHREIRKQKLSMSYVEFRESYIIRDDINSYIERTWSRERYEAAIKAYDGAIVLHDVAMPGSVVHTDYPILAASNINNLILTHSPDDFVSTKVLSRPGKVFRIVGDSFYEEIDGRFYKECADVYVKQKGKNFVGFKDKKGTHTVVKNNDGTMGIEKSKNADGFKVTLYTEVNGGYYPALDKPNQEYHIRPDGEVEKVTYNKNKSVGEIAKNYRDRVTPEIKLK